MADITQINAQIWTGAAISGGDAPQLISDGITGDIDCRIEQDDKTFLDGYPQIAYLWNGVDDDGQPKPVSWFQTSWQFAQPILSNNGVVLAHCAGGVNRGPSTAYFLLRAYFKMTPGDAFSLLVAKRPQVQAIYKEYADQAIVALGL